MGVSLARVRVVSSNFPTIVVAGVRATHHFHLCHSEEERRGIYSQFGIQNGRFCTKQLVDSSSFLLGMTRVKCSLRPFRRYVYCACFLKTWSHA